MLENEVNIRPRKQIFKTDPSMRAKRKPEFCLSMLPAGMNFYNYLILLKYLLHTVKCTAPNTAP